MKTDKCAVKFVEIINFCDFKCVRMVSLLNKQTDGGHGVIISNYDGGVWLKAAKRVRKCLIVLFYSIFFQKIN